MSCLSRTCASACARADASRFAFLYFLLFFFCAPVPRHCTCTVVRGSTSNSAELATCPLGWRRNRLSRRAFRSPDVAQRLFWCSQQQQQQRQRATRTGADISSGRFFLPRVQACLAVASTEIFEEGRTGARGLRASRPRLLVSQIFFLDYILFPASSSSLLVLP